MVRVRGVRGFSIVAVVLLAAVMITQVRRGPAPRSDTACLIPGWGAVSHHADSAAQRPYDTTCASMFTPTPFDRPTWACPANTSQTSGFGLRRLPACGCAACILRRRMPAVQR